MTSQYKWTDDSLPVLKPHSKCKHDILYEYLLRYIAVLHTGTLRYPNKKFNLSIVDGFSGGGKYDYKGQEINGSPFLILDAIEVAKAEIAITRSSRGMKTIDIDIDTFLIEKNKKVANYLYNKLVMEGKLTDKVSLICGDFNDQLPNIIERINRKSGGHKGRCLFFLDQYGYSDVNISDVGKILRSLKSEVILTFAVDHLVDYLSKYNENILQRMDFSPSQIDSLLSLSRNTKGNRHTIEHILTEHIRRSTGAKYYTPFFIQGDDTHRGYWLVHLSDHYRARDEMMNIHWNKGNDIRHFGSAGMDMLSYRSANDPVYTGQYDLDDFDFSSVAKKRVLISLEKDLREFIHNREEITFRQLMSELFNHTPAKREFIVDALGELVATREVIISPRNVKTIADSDVIRISPHKIIPLVQKK